MKDKTKIIKGHKSHPIGLTTDKDVETNGRSTAGEADMEVTDQYEFVASEDEENELDPKKRHNHKEKKRKERIGSNIRKLWQLIPIEYHVSGHKETLVSMLEKSRDYVSFLQKKLDKYLLGQGDQALAQDVDRLSNKVDQLTLENERLLRIVKESGGMDQWKSKQKPLVTENNDVTSLATSNGDSDKVKEFKDKESKSKKRNTVSAHLKRFQTERVGSLDTDDSDTDAAHSGLMVGGSAGGMVAMPPLMIPPGLTPGGSVPFMQDSNGMMFLSPNMSAFLNSPAPNINTSGADDMNNAGLLTLANTATALTSSQCDVTDAQKPGDITTPQTITSLNTSMTSSSSSTAFNVVTKGNGVQQSSTTDVTPSQSNAPIMSTNTQRPGVTNTVGSLPGPGPLTSANQSAPNGPTLILQNGQLLLVPPQGHMGVPAQRPNADGQSLGVATSQSSSSAPTTSASTALPAINTSTNITPGAPARVALNSSQTPNMTLGPGGVRIPGVMRLPGAVPGQIGTQQQIVIGPNGQPMILQNTPQSVPNTPIFSQSQPSTNINSLSTTNQLPGGGTPATNQNPPNQLPNALILPNGQVVPVVTQPQLLFPNSCLPVSGGYIMPTGNMARPSSSLATARLNAPVLPTSSQSQLSNPLGAGLLMTSSAASMASVSTTASSSVPGGGVGGVTLKPPLITGVGQPQFLPPNMAATSATMATVTSLATSKNTSGVNGRLAMSATNLPPSSVNSANSASRPQNVPGAPNLLMQKRGGPLGGPGPPTGPLLVQGPQGPRLFTQLGPTGLVAPPPLPSVTSQTDGSSSKPTGVTMTTVTTDTPPAPLSSTVSTIKVTVPGTVPKTVVSMATAVLSADGTIVVTLPPGADPKNFVINQGNAPRSSTPGGMSPAGPKAGSAAGGGGGKGRVLMPKPSGGILGTAAGVLGGTVAGAPLGLPMGCLTPDSMIGSPQSAGTPFKNEKLVTSSDVTKPLSIMTSSGSIVTKSASASPSGSTSTGASGTDILAKAAASIFSSGAEISPTPGNYDDNPLQIDTGAAEQPESSSNEQSTNIKQSANQQPPSITQQPTIQQFPQIITNSGQPLTQPMLMQQPVIIPQQLQLQQQEIQLLQQQQQQQESGETVAKKPKKSKKKKKEKSRDEGMKPAVVPTPQQLLTNTVQTGAGSVAMTPLGVPTTTLVGSNNMQLIGANHAQVLQQAPQAPSTQDVAQLQQPNSNMTDRSVDSGVGSDVAILDLLDDEHQVAPPNQSKSPEKGQDHKVKHQGQACAETDAKACGNYVDISSGDGGRKSKEKSPKDKSKKSKKSKTKAALKQPPAELDAASISASITASLKSPSDVPDDLSMPFTLPGFEAFEEPQPETQSRREKHKGSRSRKKSKRDRERSVSGKDAERKGEGTRQADMLNGEGTRQEAVMNGGATREADMLNGDGTRQADMLPESITFTENELSDVLDQVESLGQSFSSGEEAAGAVVKSQASVIIESALDAHNRGASQDAAAGTKQADMLNGMGTSVTTPSKKSKSSRKKKKSFETPDQPPSKKKKLESSDSLDASADILERAMEDIGPLNMDYSENEGPADVGDKMMIDLSGQSEGDNMETLPPYSANKSPTKPVASSSSSTKKKTSPGMDSQTNKGAPDTLNIPTFSYGPVNTGSKEVPPIGETENEGTTSKSVVKEVTKDLLPPPAPQLSAPVTYNAQGAASFSAPGASFYGDMEGELTINTDTTTSRSDKPGSPSPVAIVKSASPSPVSMGKFLDLPPMTPRTVDHLAKSFGCDAVTPFDGDSLANMDNDDYPWLNTPNFAAPATPGTARHTNIASLARFDTRPVATPKHVKTDAKSTTSANQANAQTKAPINDTKSTSGVSNKVELSVNKTSDKPADGGISSPDHPISSPDHAISSPHHTLSSLNTNINSSLQKSQPILTIPPFNGSNTIDKSSNQLQQSGSQSTTNNSQSGNSSRRNSQSVSSTGDKSSPSASRDVTMVTSPAGSNASLKTPDSTAGSSVVSTSPIKHNKSPAGSSGGRNTGAGYPQNRLSPAGSGKSSSSVLSVVQPPMPLSKLSASMRPIDTSLPASSSASTHSSTNQNTANNSSSYPIAPMMTSAYSQEKPYNSGSTSSTTSSAIVSSSSSCSYTGGGAHRSSQGLSASPAGGTARQGHPPPGGTSRQESFGFPPPPAHSTFPPPPTGTGMGVAGVPGPPPGGSSFIPSFSLPPTTSGTSTFSFSLSGTSNSNSLTHSGAHSLTHSGAPRYNGPTPPQAQFPFYPPGMVGPPMGQPMMPPPPMQGSQVMHHPPGPLNLPTFGMDSSGSGGSGMNNSGMSSSTSGGMGSSTSGPSGGDRSRGSNTSGSGSGTSQSPHAAGMSGPGHYAMPYGGPPSNTSINSDSSRFSDNTQRLSHNSGSKNMPQRTGDNVANAPPNQTVGTTPSNPRQTNNRPVGRSPHGMTSAPGSSFYPSTNQFQSPPSGSQSQGRTQSSGSQSAAPLPTPPLHHHGGRIIDQSTTSSGRPVYGSSVSSQPYGGGSSNFSGSSSFDPPPLHYTSNRPPSTHSTTSNQSVSSQKSSSQSRSSSETRNKHGGSSKNSQKSSSSSTSGSGGNSRSKQTSGSKKSSSGSSASVGNKLYEVDTNLSNSIFESRSMTPMFHGMGLSPPPGRNLGVGVGGMGVGGPPDGPTYIPGNLFNAPRPLSNSNTLQHKGHHPHHPHHPSAADMPPFNPLFPPSAASRGAQNSLGLNFQPGFPPPGVNTHSSHQSSGHMTLHTTSVSMPHHLPGYLGNMFPEMAPPPPPGGSTTQVTQSDSLNISPIKFQHGAAGAHGPGGVGGILGPPQPPPGLGDPAGLQHPHHPQAPPTAAALYNRAHPAMGINPMAAGMSINSLLGQHHHGFDARSITPSTMAPPFGHVHTSSFGMPNFLMHDH